MAQIFGKTFSKPELLTRVGHMSQIAGIRPVTLTNGNENGVRALEFYTGSGFRFTVLSDRAMDIFDASYKGQSLAWHSPTGAVAPAYYDRHDVGWLWNFYGGLVVTCGLTQVGAVDNDDGEELGLHGRISNTPAKNVCFGTDWEGDDYVLWASAEIREARLFGPNLLLRRSIHTKLGENRIWISDEIENQGFHESPLQVLYHCNFGFPIINNDSEMLAVINRMEPRDDEAHQGVEIFDTFEGPTPGYAEQCFFIDHDTDEKMNVHVALVNRHHNGGQGIGAYISYPKKELPYFTEWKMIGEGEYAVGLEPGNCLPEGRGSARRRGVLKFIAPGEKKTFHLEIGVLPTNNEIRGFEARLRGITS